jgi:hypothetical protein
MRYMLITIRALLLLGLVPQAVLAAGGDCNKACMEQIADRYRAAYLAHDARSLPLASHVRYSENGVVMKFPDGSWDTVTKEVGPPLTLSDTKTGNVGVYTAILQNDIPGYLAIRLKIAGGKISEIEHMLSTKRNLSAPPTPFGELEQYQPDRHFLDIVDPAKRLPRARLVSHANGYFSTLQNNTGEIRGTRFKPDASRIENGRRFPEIEKGFLLGYYRFNERVRDRDFFLVDEERQVVMARGFIDHKGVLDEYTLTDGTKQHSVYHEPHTWAFLEMFKVEDDAISAVQAVFIGAPYYMPPPWPQH